MRGAERFWYVVLALLVAVALRPAAGQASADSAYHALTLPIAIGQRLSCQNKDSASRSLPSFGHRKLDVTPTEKLRAKALAAWVWKHQCHKHPSALR